MAHEEALDFGGADFCLWDAGGELSGHGEEGGWGGVGCARGGGGRVFVFHFLAGGDDFVGSFGEDVQEDLARDFSVCIAEEDFAVDAAGTQESGVERVGGVGSHYDKSAVD